MKFLKLYLLLPLFIIVFSTCKKIDNLNVAGKEFTGEWLSVKSSIIGEDPSFITITNDSLIMQYGTYTKRVKYNLNNNTITYTYNLQEVSLNYEMADENLILISTALKGTIKLQKYGNSAGFDIIGFLGVLILGIAGLFMLVPSTINYYYAFISSSWEVIKARITSVDVIIGKYNKYTDYTRSTYGMGSGVEITESSSLFNYSKISTTIKKPLINFTYEVDGKVYYGNSAEMYNHKSTYSVSDAKKLMDNCKANGLNIKVNLKNAVEVYLGARHFPWILNFILFVFGAFFTIGITVVFSDLMKVFGYEPILFGGNVKSTLLILPIIIILIIIFRTKKKHKK